MEKYFCEIKPVYERKAGFRQHKIINSKQLSKLAKKLIPKDCVNLREVFGAMFLDSQLKTLGYNIITYGGITGTVVDIKQLLQNALICNATQIAIFHNHPSGNSNPSKADIEMTDKVKQACEVIGFALVDSLIVTQKSVISIMEND